MKTYRINRRNEECDCAQCGCPMFIGDKVTETDNDNVACGTACAKKLGDMYKNHGHPRTAVRLFGI